MGIHELLDVSFGMLAFLPLGWLFMAVIIFMECALMSRVLTKKWYDKPIYRVLGLSNALSGLTGIILSIWLNGGWFLVVWFPWVSSNEVNIYRHHALQKLLIYYLMAFALTLVIEMLFNYWRLKKYYPVRGVLWWTVLVNIASYIFGGFILYGFSFGLF